MSSEKKVDGANDIPWLDNDEANPVPSRVQERNDAADELAGKTKGKKAVWQFKYRRYRHVLPFEDPTAETTPTGHKPNAVIFARNWRRELDLTDEYDKKIHAALLADPQCGVDFSLLTSVRKTDTISERADTLRRLNEMDVRQLSSMLTKEEKIAAGLLPNCVDKMQLIMAIIDTKKMATKEE